MKTIINIGTSLGNIVGIKIDKPFDDINYTDDIVPIIKKRFPNKGYSVHGWCDVTPKEKKNKKL